MSTAPWVIKNMRERHAAARGDPLTSPDTDRVLVERMLSVFWFLAGAAVVALAWWLS